MNTTFDLSITQDCVLLIQDTTQSYCENCNKEYLEEDSNLYVTKGRFKYSDTYTINVIKYVSSNDDILNTGGTIEKVLITPHVDNAGLIMYCDEAMYDLKKDGHYVIDHLIIPSLQCINNLIEKEYEIIPEYDYIYATDGINFYKYINNNYTVCSIDELISINSDSTTISKSSQDTFSICNLHKCYLNLQ